MKSIARTFAAFAALLIASRKAGKSVYPRDHPPAKRRPDTYRGPPVTLGDMRSHGVRRLLIYCSSGLYCHHSATVDADRWPDQTVLLDLDRRAVCTSCGIVGADVRPNWSERSQRESLTGVQWR
jgi:hypothetical protein